MSAVLRRECVSEMSRCESESLLSSLCLAEVKKRDSLVSPSGFFRDPRLALPPKERAEELGLQLLLALIRRLSPANPVRDHLLRDVPPWLDNSDSLADRLASSPDEEDLEEACRRIVRCVPSPTSDSTLRFTFLPPFRTHFACFDSCGEPCICFAQFLGVLFFNNELPEVAHLMADLQINLSTASAAQVRALLAGSYLIPNSYMAHLIRKSDAQRIIGEFFSGPKRTLKVKRDDLHFVVEHACFGGCEGTIYPFSDHNANGAVVVCNECDAQFTPLQFVLHTHSREELDHTIHWGFSADNWRDYLNLRYEDMNSVDLVRMFNAFIKEKYVTPLESPDYSSEVAAVVEAQRVIAEGAQEDEEMNAARALVTNAFPEVEFSQLTPQHFLAVIGRQQRQIDEFASRPSSFCDREVQVNDQEIEKEEKESPPRKKRALDSKKCGDLQNTLFHCLFTGNTIDALRDFLTEPMLSFVDGKVREWAATYKQWTNELSGLMVLNASLTSSGSSLPPETENRLHAVHEFLFHRFADFFSTLSPSTELAGSSASLPVFPSLLPTSRAPPPFPQTTTLFSQLANLQPQTSSSLALHQVIEGSSAPSTSLVPHPVQPAPLYFSNVPAVPGALHQVLSAQPAPPAAPSLQAAFSVEDLIRLISNHNAPNGSATNSL